MVWSRVMASEHGESPIMEIQWRSTAGGESKLVEERITGDGCEGRGVRDSGSGGHGESTGSEQTSKRKSGPEVGSVSSRQA